jgi:mRNA-degrading endonuclease YafQ of YafQ-DinJ toxin-antitoxin module
MDEVRPNSFDKKLEKLEKKDKVTFERVQKAFKKIRAKPDNRISHFLKADFRGKRSYPVTDKFRVFYAYCEECRRLGHTIYNECANCADIQDDTIVWFNIGDHKIYQE